MWSVSREARHTRSQHSSTFGDAVTLGVQLYEPGIPKRGVHSMPDIASGVADLQGCRKELAGESYNSHTHAHQTHASVDTYSNRSCAHPSGVRNAVLALRQGYLRPARLLSLAAGRGALVSRLWPVYTAGVQAAWPFRVHSNMVLYFHPIGYGPGKDDNLIYVGKDKHENEDLIKYGLPQDIW